MNQRIQYYGPAGKPLPIAVMLDGDMYKSVTHVCPVAKCMYFRKNLRGAKLSLYPDFKTGEVLGVSLGGTWSTRDATILYASDFEEKKLKRLVDTKDEEDDISNRFNR